MWVCDFWGGCLAKAIQDSSHLWMDSNKFNLIN